MKSRFFNYFVSAGIIAPAQCTAGLLLGILSCMLLGCSDRSSANSSDATTAREVSPASISEEEIRATLDAAEQYFNAGDNGNARMILIRLVREAPHDLTARELLGQVFAAEAVQHDAAGRADAAFSSRMSAWEQYRQAVDIAPDQAGLHHSAALMALAAGEREPAIHLLRDATRLDPTQMQYPLYLAQLLIQDSRIDDAEQLITKALHLDHDEPYLHATLAAIELERSNYQQALHHVREARTIAPDETALRVQEAKILRRSDQPREALELLTSLPPGELAQEFVAWEIASNYELLGEPILVAQTWERCFRADPLHPNAFVWAVRIGEALLLDHRVAEATLWLEHAQRLNPHAAETRHLQDLIEDLDDQAR